MVESCGLSRAEIERLGKTLRAAAVDGEHPTAPAANQFVLLTGFRRMEGLGVERDWLDEEEGAIRFPDEKSGAQNRVIGPPTTVVQQELRFVGHAAP